MNILFIINLISGFLTLLYFYYLLTIVNKYAAKVKREDATEQDRVPLVKNKEFQKKAYILGILVLINIITAVAQWGKSIF